MNAREAAALVRSARDRRRAASRDGFTPTWSPIALERIAEAAEVLSDAVTTVDQRHQPDRAGRCRSCGGKFPCVTAQALLRG